MSMVHFLDSNTREIYVLVNGFRVVCCTIPPGVSLPVMEKVRALHEIMSHAKAVCVYDE